MRLATSRPIVALLTGVELLAGAPMAVQDAILATTDVLPARLAQRICFELELTVGTRQGTWLARVVELGHDLLPFVVAVAGVVALRRHAVRRMIGAGGVSRAVWVVLVVALVAWVAPSVPEALGYWWAPGRLLEVLGRDLIALVLRVMFIGCLVDAAWRIADVVRHPKRESCRAERSIAMTALWFSPVFAAILMGATA